MPRISYVNGRYIPHSEALVHVEDRGYQFADGVYEYIAFYNRTLLDLSLHLKRLERSLKELEILMPVASSVLPILIRELVERNGRNDGGLYLQVTRGVAKRDHPFPKHAKPILVMTVCAPKLPKQHEVQSGVKVITSPDIRWARRDIKSIALLPNVLAKQGASRQQAREAWLFDEKNIVSEGAVSNAYIITKSGEIITHPADVHILPGITRHVVLQLARKAGIKVKERAFSVADARKASEAFLTSTSANILPVVTIDGKRVGNGKPGSVTSKLQQLYAAHIFKQTGKQL
jgi:D-alanine transaminase